MTQTQRFANGGWPRAEPLRTERLELEPLTVEHARELAPLLDDQRLHEFTGGRPLSESALRERFTRQVGGASPDGSAGWLNWVIRGREDGAALGTVQATLTREGAELAWVVGVAHQGRGVASEAASAVADWLAGLGVTRLRAHVAPGHAGSEGVARRLGMRPTEVRRAGEVRWER